MDLAGVAAVLFDMDGTLVDSHAAVERAWRAWAGRYRVDADEVLAIAHGVPAPDTVRRVRPDLSDREVDAAAAHQLELQYEDLSDVVPTPGTERLLAALARLEMPWAVVTSADPPLAAARLGVCGIEPPLLITVEDVPAGKPDPAGYLLAAHRLGVAPERCLVVEDAEAGVAAGRAAGALVAGLRGQDADLQPRDLGELAEWLESGR
jgi:sugar-phosphatase